MMTPTQLQVTEEQYNLGSSARCHCGAINYFLMSLVDVSYQWNCAKCGEDNFHPCHRQARDKISELRHQLQILRDSLNLAIVVTDDTPRYNHQFSNCSLTAGEGLL
jgi:hypothetical protein